MKSSFAYKLLIILNFIIFQCNAQSTSAYLIENIDIVQVDNGELLESQFVTIQDGLITSISSKQPIETAKFIRINGKGKFLLPGLAEMHAHIPPPSATTQRVEDVLFLYLSNGITTIRGMLGDSSHLALRKASEEGMLLSPRIFTSSPSLNGNTVQTEEEADQKVRKYKEDGYDFLKIHPGIQREVFDQIVKTSREVGISFAGHVPVDVGIEHALRSRYASIDHVDGFLEGLVADPSSVNPEENGFFGYNFTPLADENKIDELVELSKENKVWIVPTQSLFERWFAPIEAAVLIAQPEMQYMPAATRRSWIRVKNQTMEDQQFNLAQWTRFDQIRHQLIKQLAENGHGILMGSDAPQLFNVPGFSIHHEIDGMQNAGMDKLSILRSGTMNPAIFFGQEKVFGKVREGMVADLIILGGNPLEDLDHLQNPNAVFRGGRYIDREYIDQRLSEIASRCMDK